MDVAAHLDEAAQHVHDPVRAIEHVLAAWRRIPALALADLIDELATRLPVQPPITDVGEWQRVAATPRTGEVARLIGLRDPALLGLMAWPRDPRINRALASFLAWTHGDDYRRLLGFLVDGGDPGTLDAVAPFHGEPAAILRDRAARAILDEPGGRAFDRLMARRAAHLGMERTLIDQVCIDPDDDAPRLVFGDWLERHGDPRGELIALQCRDHLTDDQQRRVDELVRAHGEVWLGDLAPHHVVPLAYQRGFVSAVALERPSELHQTLTCADWATVRAIECRLQNIAIDELFHRQAPRIGVGLASVRSVTGLGPRQLASLGAGPPLPITSLGVYDFPGARDTTVDLRRLPALTGVTRLALHFSSPWLIDCELLPRLRELEVRLDDDDGPWLTEVLAGGRGLERIRLWLRGVEVRILDGRSRLELRLEPGPADVGARLRSLLARLGSIRELVVVGPRSPILDELALELPVRYQDG